MRTLRIAPALAEHTWHAGRDRSGNVRVEVDGPGSDVRVTLAAGWRAEPGPARLGQAVVAAHGEAVIARMTAWALEGQHTPSAPQTQVPATEQAATVTAAHRELAVFRRRLTELRAVPVTVEGGADVQVTVREGRPVSVVLGRADHADDVLAEALATGLRCGLAAIAGQPALALASCPALRAVLGTSQLPLPFEL